MEVNKVSICAPFVDLNCILCSPLDRVLTWVNLGIQVDASKPAKRAGVGSQYLAFVALIGSLLSLRKVNGVEDWRVIELGSGPDRDRPTVGRLSASAWP